MATILVTGGTGFIGSSLATKLYGYGHNVIISGTGDEQICSYSHFIGNDLDKLRDFKKIDIGEDIDEAVEYFVDDLDVMDTKFINKFAENIYDYFLEM